MPKTYHAILFTSCPTINSKPFGAHKAAHELRQHGFNVLVVNYTHLYSMEELIHIVNCTVSDQTLFVGLSNTFLGYTQIKNANITVTTQAFNAFLPQGFDADHLFVSHIKSINQNCKIVLGGTRTYPNYNHKNVDYVVMGYADVSIVSLAQHLKSGTPISVKNYKNVYGKYILEDMEAATFDFNHSTMTWCDDDVVVPGEVLPLEISRGCIFSCKFCAYRLNGKKTLDYLKNFDIIHTELLNNYKNYNITKYRLLDDTFNDTEEKIDIMLDIVKQLPFQPQFGGYARLDLLVAKPHTIQKLFDIGFRHMFFGIETLNKKTGSIVGKGGDPEKLIQTVIDMKNLYGDQVTLHGSFIVGLPEENKKSIAKTMQKLINRELPLDSVTYYPLEINKKTAHHPWDSAFNIDYEKYGYTEILSPTSNDFGAMNWQSPHMTHTEAIEIAKDFALKYKGNPTQHLYVSETDLIADYRKKLFKYLDHPTTQEPPMTQPDTQEPSMINLDNFLKFEKDRIFIDADYFIAKNYQVNSFCRERIEKMLVLHYKNQPIFIKSHDGANFDRSGVLIWIKTLQQAFNIPNYKIIFNTIANVPTYPWLAQELRAFKDADRIQLEDINYDLSNAKFVGALCLGRWNLYRFSTIFELDKAFPGDTFITHHPGLSEFNLAEFSEFEEELNWVTTKEFNKDPSSQLIPDNHAGQISYTTAYEAYPLLWHEYQIEVAMETDEYQTHWFTDKVAKCLATGKPFVMLGGKHSLKNLKTLGFKTFDQYIDESYDNCTLPYQRILAMIGSLKVLYQDPNKQKILAAMQETAKENREIFQQYVQSKI